MTYDRFDPATDDPERRINQEPHAVKVNQRDLVKAVDTTKYGEQPTPHGTGKVIVDLVLADIAERVRVGEDRYGEKLKAFNGRNALQDAYEEALDKVMYLRQALEEARENEVRMDYFSRVLERFLATVRTRYGRWPDGGQLNQYSCFGGIKLGPRAKGMLTDIVNEAAAEGNYNGEPTARMAGEESKDGAVL